MDVKEMYLSDGNVKTSKYVLSIMEDGTVTLIWYMGNTRFKEKNPTISKMCDGSMKIEFGDTNLMGTRPHLPFIDENGNLEPTWEKIR